MGKKLFVGSVSWNTTDEGLSKAFEKYGVASATIIKDRMSGRSKGFGFVEITDDAQADLAIQEMNGVELDGRKIIVNEARPPREGGGFNRGGGRGGFDRE